MFSVPESSALSPHLQSHRQFLCLPSSSLPSSSASSPPDFPLSPPPLAAAGHGVVWGSDLTEWPPGGVLALGSGGREACLWELQGPLSLLSSPPGYLVFCPPFIRNSQVSFMNVGVEQMLKATRDFVFNFVVPPLPAPMRKTFCVTSIKFGNQSCGVRK